MAKKRFVFIEKGEGKYCRFYSKWYDECSFYMDRKGTEHCKKCKKGFTRTEAIERMAKAMWNRNQKQIARTNKEFVITLWETIERPSPNTQIFLEEAEAALNALLEVNRNE